METSELMREGRLGQNLPQKHIDELKTHLNQKDFHSFAKVVMRESNQLHAICLDTYPPIQYMNSYTRRVIHTCSARINTDAGKPIVAYSVDAGFHIFLFTLSHNLEAVKRSLVEAMGNGQASEQEPWYQSIEVFERVIETGIGKHGSS
mmetsp:Transcript_8498/g.14294  ORF Transcript_8498/g.14294 Transcript_8498/m.14294 type:complete len:148 (-) Transcript_8498:37-480(-)